MSKAILVLPKMPENCEECIFCYKSSYCSANGKMMPYKLYRWERESDCPLIEAPEPWTFENPLQIRNDYNTALEHCGVIE